MKEDKDSVFYRYIFAGIILIILIFVFCITFLPIPEGNERFADTVIGFLLGIVSTLVTWKWGTSKTSSDKDETIKKQIQTSANAAVVASVSPMARDSIVKEQIEVSKE